MDQLREVVAIAKSKQRVGSLDIDERDISMSISKLSADEISELNVASVDEALQDEWLVLILWLIPESREVACQSESEVLLLSVETTNR